MRKFLGLCAGLAFVLAVVLSGSADAKVGAKCGGSSSLKCGKHEFCEKPTGSCFFPDGEGTCVKVPVVCPFAKKGAAIVAPVCGCNNKTYGNDCLREHAKVSKSHDGKCF
jgi:hypothetical protein